MLLLFKMSINQKKLPTKTQVIFINFLLKKSKTTITYIFLY